MRHGRVVQVDLRHRHLHLRRRHPGWPNPATGSHPADPAARLALRRTIWDAVEMAMTYGPAVVETMQTVLERQQATGTQPKLVSGSRNGAQGTWFIPSRRDHPPAHSEPHALINKWGDTCMAIGFGRLVDFEGAWFAGQAAPGVWTTGIGGA